MRFYVPLAPLVIVAAVASVNACGKQQEAARPRPAPALLVEAPPKPAAPVLAAAPEAKPEPEPAPTPEEVREFQKPVLK